MKIGPLSLIVTTLAVLLQMGPASATQIKSAYTLKKSEIPIPAGTKKGQVKRIIQPFGDWTLICDENLKERTKVCNVTQEFVNGGGNTVFSWSLSASEKGDPVFILRVPAGVGIGNKVKVHFYKHKKAATTPVLACDENVCIALLTVGARIRKSIATGSSAEISYETNISHKLVTNLRGLAHAVSMTD